MYKIGKFSRLTGISISTLRKWDQKGILKPSFKTLRGTINRKIAEKLLNEKA
jgi:DNA-binding transcriptional MerR regulator